VYGSSALKSQFSVVSSPTLEKYSASARAFDQRQQFVNDDGDQQNVDDRDHRHVRPRR
jgi:hypothetical protein